MAKNKEIRTVRMDQLKRQYAERVIGDDSLVRVEVGESKYVWMKLPVMLAEGDDYGERLASAGRAEDGEAVALVVLSGHPDHDAAEQWATWQAAGYDSSDLAMAFKAEMDAAKDRMETFRYAG